MDSSNTVLVAASDGDAWIALVESLSATCGYRVLYAHTFDEATALLSSVHIDLVIAEQIGSGPAAPERSNDADDHPDGRCRTGCEFLATIRTRHPEVIRVLALDELPYDIARAAVYQFLHLPLDSEQACLVVRRGLEARELSRRHRRLSREFKLSDRDSRDLTRSRETMQFETLVYVSEKMAEVCDQARIAARTDLPVLIQGETGTGKELLARAIHDHSQRHSNPLLVQNCSGVPDGLLQSEMFGHRRGAFTGAVSDRLGLFQAAHGGTVFLDEISEVSPAFQVGLLRFLQERKVKPLGADHSVTSNVRIIAASSRSLKLLAARGEFRRDLYYRLKGFEFEVPALRERTADIAPLAELFVARHSENARRRPPGISARVFAKFIAYHWPGNIRELENEIRRLVVLTGDDEYITTQHMTPGMLAATPPPAPHLAWGGRGTTLKDQVQSLEKQLVHETLERCHWNQSKAAGELGLSRVGLANKIRRYGLAEA